MLETRNRSRDVAPGSGICTRCMDDCAGNCDVFKAAMRGREVIYPGPFGQITAGSDKKYPVDYSHLNIMGYAVGAKAIDEANPDKAIFPVVDTTTVYGHNHPVRMKMPIFCLKTSSISYFSNLPPPVPFSPGWSSSATLRSVPPEVRGSPSNARSVRAADR